MIIDRFTAPLTPDAQAYISRASSGSRQHAMDIDMVGHSQIFQKPPKMHQHIIHNNHQPEDPFTTAIRCRMSMAIGVGETGEQEAVRIHPSRVVDAPNLEDDFYLNLLDWGRTADSSLLAIGLRSEVMLWNASSMTVNHRRMTALATRRGKDDSVASVAWLKSVHATITLYF